MDSIQAELERFGPKASPRLSMSAAESRRYCWQLAHRHYENFTVASRLLPRSLNQHLCNVYAYCRWADDLADEVGDSSQSLELLDWWESELRACYVDRELAVRDDRPGMVERLSENDSGEILRPPSPPAPLPFAGEGRNAGAAVDEKHPVFVALAETIERFNIPPDPFVDLLTAFRRDQRQTRYETAEDVLDYCRCSANPVGRLVLYLGECCTPERVRLSDSVCTGLQLANFCQDVARDWRNGRVYLPMAACREFGFDETMFAAGQCNEAFRGLMASQVEFAEGFLQAGIPLIAQMPVDLRLAVALFIHGGLATLQAIRRLNYDVWLRRPTLSKFDKLRLLARCWWNVRCNRFEGMDAAARQ